MIVNTYNKNKHEIAESHPINEEIKKSKSKMLPQKCPKKQKEEAYAYQSLPLFSSSQIYLSWLYNLMYTHIL